MTRRSEAFENHQPPLSIPELVSLEEYKGTAPVMFRHTPIRNPQGVIIILALLAQSCGSVGQPSPNINTPQIPGLTQPADCPPLLLCEAKPEAVSPEEVNRTNSLRLRELLGITPATTQAQLAQIIRDKQQNTDWLYRKLSDGKTLASPGNLARLFQFYNTEGQELTYGLDYRGENLIHLPYSPKERSVPQYPDVPYLEFDKLNNVGTVPMRYFTDGSNSIYLYASEDTLNVLIPFWQPDDVKNFLHGYFGSPDSGIIKRLHLVFAPSSQGIQLGVEQPFRPTSDIEFAAVFSSDSESFEVVLNIPAIHAGSKIQGLSVPDSLGATLVNERLGFIALGYPQIKPKPVPMFETMSTLGEWLYLFDPEMRNMLMGGSDTYSNFLNPLANFLEQTVPLVTPQISP